MSVKTKIYVATANKNKVKEIFNILSKYLDSSKFEVSIHPEYEKLTVVEDGDTFEENAIIKAIALSEKTDGYVIADDSGLCVDALDGAPGVYSARYAGDSSDDSSNNIKLLESLSKTETSDGAENKVDRSAQFICVIALAKDGYIVATSEGVCRGSICDQPAGSGGFGYDPIFMLPEGKTMAELNNDEKDSISHRHNALYKLANFLKDELI